MDWNKNEGTRIIPTTSTTITVATNSKWKIITIETTTITYLERQTDRYIVSVSVAVLKNLVL